MSDFRYDWGETVRVIATAPVHLCPGEIAAVCGVRKTSLSQLISGNPTVDASVESFVYLVEFGDGFAIEIPETFLELVGEQQSDSSL